MFTEAALISEYVKLYSCGKHENVLLTQISTLNDTVDVKLKHLERKTTQAFSA